MKKTLLTICYILAIAFIFFGLFCGLAIIETDRNFKENCVDHLTKATNTDSVETAKEELEKAIFFVETKNLTQGNTSIFLNKPENDIGYWYENLKSCYKDLEILPENLNPSEKRNALMKLRKSLLDCSTTNSIRVKLPKNISSYPNRLSFLGLFLFIIGVLVVHIIDWYDDDSQSSFIDDDWG